MLRRPSKVLDSTLRVSIWRSSSCACQSRPFSHTPLSSSHDNPLGLPRNDAPPTMPRMQRGLPTKRRIPGVRRVVVVASGKGGVGKSSVAVNLALSLSNRPGQPRLRVGLLDLDIFGPSIPKLMALEGMGEPILTKDNRLTPMKAHGIPCMSMGFLLPNSPSSTNNADTPVVWRGMMVMKAVQQLLFDVDWTAGNNGQELDVLVVDTPPGTGDVALSLGQLVIVDGSVIVSTPQDVAILDTRKGVAMFRKLQIPILGAVLNMSHFLCPSSTTPHYIFGPPTSFRTACDELSIDVLAEIPIEPTVSARGDQGTPIALGSSSLPPVGGAGVSPLSTKGIGAASGGYESTSDAGGADDSQGRRGSTATTTAHPSAAEQAFRGLADKVWGRLGGGGVAR